MEVEEYEVIFPFKREHSETCPFCVTEESDPEIDPTMVRRTGDVYQCEECGLLILAGYDRYKMGIRILLGMAFDGSIPLDKMTPAPDGVLKPFVEKILGKYKPKDRPG